MTFALLALIVIVVVSSSGRARARWTRQEELSEAIYAELDELRVRVAELEDHRDFAERVLADRSAADPAAE